MVESKFNPQIEAVRDRATLLRQAAGSMLQHSPVLEQAFEELGTTLEELEVAEEELRAQNQELLEARAQIEAERQRYQTLFASAPVGYLVTNPAGVIREANSAAADLLGVAARILVGKPLASYIPVDERQTFRRQLIRLSNNQRIEDWRLQIKPRDRAAIYASVTVTYEEQPEPSLRWMVHDVTARVQAERQIQQLNELLEERVHQRTKQLEEAHQATRDLLRREQEAHAQADSARRTLALLAEAGALLNSSLDYQMTLNNVVRLVVPRLADSCAVDLLESDGRITRLAIADIDPQRENKLREIGERSPLTIHGSYPIERVLRTGQSEIYAELGEELIATLRQSEERFNVLRDLPLTSYICAPLMVHGDILGGLTLVMTTSGRRYTADDLAFVEELARRVAQAIDNARLYAEAQDAIQLRHEFLSVAAHELRTPITSLQGFTQVTMRRLERDGVIDPDWLRRALRMIDQQSQKLTALVGQLLDVSRVEAGRLPLDRLPTDVTKLVEGIIMGAQSTTDQHTLRFSGDQPVQAVVDPLRLEQVISNLLDNAIKFSPDGGAIDVGVVPIDSAWLEITVRDYGVGVPASNRDRIFDRFFQIRDRGPSGGMGLGLYISRQIVELHGGAVTVEAPPGGGSLFRIRLPSGRSSSQ